MKRSIMLMLTAAAAAAPAAALAQSAKIRLAVIPSVVCAQAFAAADLGLFRKHGLDVDVEVLPSGNAVAQALLGGAVDVGLADTVSVATAHERGLPLTFAAPGLVSSLNAPTFGALVKGDSPIKDGKDFSGATVAIPALNTLAHIVLMAWIDRNGGDARAARWLEIPLPQEVAAVAQGTVAASVPPEPFLTQGLEQGQRLINLHQNGLAPAFMVSGWATTKSWLAKNPAPAGAVTAAMREAAAWLNANPTAATPILAKYTKLPEGVLAHIKRGVFSERFEPRDVQPLIDAAARYKVIDKSFPAAELIG